MHLAFGSHLGQGFEDSAAGAGEMFGPIVILEEVSFLPGEPLEALANCSLGYSCGLLGDQDAEVGVDRPCGI